MEIIINLFDLIMHLDKHLDEIIKDYGTWTYLILFTIIFCETGLVVTPFLPGDSLLFVIGTLAAGGALDIGLSLALLMIAAVSGDTVNYHIGKFLGWKVFDDGKFRLIRKDYLIKAQKFYEKHGGKACTGEIYTCYKNLCPFCCGHWKDELLEIPRTYVCFFAEKVV